MFAPEAIAGIRRVPLAKLSRHLAPGRSRAQHPKDATEDGAMIMTGMADQWLLGREEGMHAGPLGVGQVAPGQGQEDRRRGGGPLTGMARAVAALGPRLVGPPPVGPAQQKGPPCRIGSQGEREVAHLGHRHLWHAPTGRA